VKINTLVWGENVHDQNSPIVAELYPGGMHTCIANTLNLDENISASTATLQEAEHGLTDERLKDSSHFSKPFKRLMGTPCALTWREAGERERLWVTSANHPITKGLPDHFELEYEEMYGEPFSVPEPLETVFISWFQGGEVFRSGLTYKRGAGNVFYFRPGHETYPTYHDDNIKKVLVNAVHWANNSQQRRTNVTDAPNTAVENALESIVERGAKLHADGEEGFK